MTGLGPRRVLRTRRGGRDATSSGPSGHLPLKGKALRAANDRPYGVGAERRAANDRPYGVSYLFRRLLPIPYFLSPVPCSAPARP